MSSTARRVLIIGLSSLGLAVSLAACGGSSSDGTQSTSTSSSQAATANTTSGPVDVAQFDSIEVSSGIALELKVDAGGQQSVEINVPDGYNGKIDTSVKGSTLTIDQGASGVITGRAVVKVTVPLLTAVSAEEGSQVEGSGELDTYQLTAAEGSQAKLSDLKAKSVQVALSEGSQATVYASESVTGSAKEGSQLTVKGSPSTLNVSSEEGSSVTSQ